MTFETLNKAKEIEEQLITLEIELALINSKEDSIRLAIGGISVITTAIDLEEIREYLRETYENKIYDLKKQLEEL